MITGTKDSKTTTPALEPMAADMHGSVASLEELSATASHMSDSITSYVSVHGDFKSLLAEKPDGMSEEVFMEFAEGEFIAHGYAYHTIDKAVVDVNHRKYTTSYIINVPEGLVSSILEPQDSKQTDIIIAFRGTKDTPSIFRDLERSAPGHDSFAEAIPSILQQINAALSRIVAANPNAKITVTLTGHSLAGADAQNGFVALMEEINKKLQSRDEKHAEKLYFHHIEKLILKVYSSAGITAETAARAKQLAEQLKSKIALELYWLHAAGDGVQQTGVASVLAEADASLAKIHFAKGKHPNVIEGGLLSAIQNVSHAHRALYFLKLQNDLKMGANTIEAYLQNATAELCVQIAKALNNKSAIPGVFLNAVHYLLKTKPQQLSPNPPAAEKDKEQPPLAAAPAVVNLKQLMQPRKQDPVYRVVVPPVATDLSTRHISLALLLSQPAAKKSPTPDKNENPPPAKVAYPKIYNLNSDHLDWLETQLKNLALRYAIENHSGNKHLIAGIMQKYAQDKKDNAPINIRFKNITAMLELHWKAFVFKNGENFQAVAVLDRYPSDNHFARGIANILDHVTEIEKKLAPNVPAKPRVFPVATPSNTYNDHYIICTTKIFDRLCKDDKSTETATINQYREFLRNKLVSVRLACKLGLLTQAQAFDDMNQALQIIAAKEPGKLRYTSKSEDAYFRLVKDLLEENKAMIVQAALPQVQPT